MDRRNFLRIGGGALAGGGLALLARRPPLLLSEDAWPPPAFSVVPVVGDGNWIWREPPKGQTGYLEPRPFRLQIGVHLDGRGDATNIKATTPIPPSLPEQTIDEEKIESDGGEAEVREINPLARQLFLSADSISKGQTISATANYKLTVRKQYQGYERHQFPESQKIPSEVQKAFLGDSPGIQTHIPQVRKLLGELRGDATHPWDLAKIFADWIPRNIKPLIGPYANVATVLERRVGDCEHMSAVFVALCRAAGIPARIVWVPNHNWSECYLVDKKGQGHWLPVHTACYFWFGWTGVHEVVLQKGDRLKLPERGNRLFRLQEDWLQWMGKKPAVRYTAELTPLPIKPGADPGPGARTKTADGKWLLVDEQSQPQFVRR